MTKLCPHCRQPLPEWREGVRLSPLKAHIFDVIKRADSNGVTFEDINAICFDGRSNSVNVGITSTRSTRRWPAPTSRFGARRRGWSDSSTS